MTPDWLSESIHNFYELPSIKPVIWYLHAAAGFITKANCINAIRRENYLTWPLVTVKNVTKHFLESEETEQGHMKGQRQVVRSTWKTKPPTEEPKALETTKKEKLHEILISTYEMKSIIYSYQTGKFQHLVESREKYQMVRHDVERNYKWVESLRNRTKGEMILGWTSDLACMKLCGITPRHQVLDNKASSAWKEAICHSGMTYQLVLPDEHRRNLA